jgi:hypothetical protein
MPQRRTCTVPLHELEVKTHNAHRARRHPPVQAGAAALGAFRQRGWAENALTPPDAAFRIEVQLPPVFHEVPLRRSTVG